MGLQGPLMGEHTKVLEVVCPELNPVYTKLVTISKTVYLHSVHPSSKLPNPEEGLWDPPYQFIVHLSEAQVIICDWLLKGAVS